MDAAVFFILANLNWQKYRLSAMNKDEYQ